MNEGLKKLPNHVLECQTHSSQVLKELAELQDFLKQLSGYAEKYKRMTENIALQGIPAKETSFSVKEDVATRSRTGLEIIELPQPEPITVISPPEDSDVDSNGSDIGIYYIDDVKPVNLINVIERELCIVKELFPSVRCIADEMKNEFDHFKVCCSCLQKVSPLLPDILKELQELIKFIKRKRNETYTWPNDSEYLRKSTEGLTKPFKKEDKDPKKEKLREETVGFVTIHTKTPKILREVESSILGEYTISGNTRRCCVRLTNHPLLSVFRSETQNDLRFIEKMETIYLDDSMVEEGGEKEQLFLTEFCTAQALRILHPVPAVEKAIQKRITGAMTHAMVDRYADGIGLVTYEDLENPFATQAQGFIMTAKVALEEACSTLRQRDDMETEKDLKDLVSETRKPTMEFTVDEILGERQVSLTHGRRTKLEKDKAIMSVISSRCFEEASKVGSRTPIPLRTTRGLRELTTEGQKLLHDLEREINTISQQRTEEIGTDAPESATINLTIKVGGEEVLSQYQSAMSVIPSETDLTQVPLTGGEQFQDTVRIKRSFTGLALQFTVPVTFSESQVTPVSKASNPINRQPKFLEASLRSLAWTIDRMDILTDKLSDDAYESNTNFKDMANRYRFISNLLSSCLFLFLVFFMVRILGMM